MITEEEYKKWKPLVEEFEEAEAADALANSLFCVECQALDDHDCFCDGEEDHDDGYCGFCCGDNHNHFLGCPYDTNPFNNLITNGYD